MKKLLLLPMLTLLAGCHHDRDTPAPDSLVGTWQLTARQCYCAPGLPNEAVSFAADNTFQFFRDGQLVYGGTYSVEKCHPCAGQPPQPLLSLHGPLTNTAYAPGGTYTLRGNTLVVDSGTACVADAPVYTYQRQ